MRVGTPRWFTVHGRLEVALLLLLDEAHVALLDHAVQQQLLRLALHQAMSGQRCIQVGRWVTRNISDGCMQPRCHAMPWCGAH